jgi:hypothetical protein
MPPVFWPLRSERPRIEIILPRASGIVVRSLLADTGAGNRRASFELVLAESDCLQLSRRPMGQTQLGGAYSGQFHVYSIEVRIPALQFIDNVPVVGVPAVPRNFDGIAGFKFLNRFQYGNFGDPDVFGLA